MNHQREGLSGSEVATIVGIKCICILIKSINSVMRGILFDISISDFDEQGVVRCLDKGGSMKYGQYLTLNFYPSGDLRINIERSRDFGKNPAMIRHAFSEIVEAIKMLQEIQLGRGTSIKIILDSFWLRRKMIVSTLQKSLHDLGLRYHEEEGDDLSPLDYLSYAADFPLRQFANIKHTGSAWGTIRIPAGKKRKLN